MKAWLRWLPPVLVAALALLWIVSPFDPLPDVIPILGWLDDLVAFVLGVGFGSGWLVYTRPRDRDPAHVLDAADIELLGARPDLLEERQRR